MLEKESRTVIFFSLCLYENTHIFQVISFTWLSIHQVPIRYMKNFKDKHGLVNANHKTSDTDHFKIPLHFQPFSQISMSQNSHWIFQNLSILRGIFTNRPKPQIYNDTVKSQSAS